jgi:A/G-specific adenine glycosylase
MKRMPIQQLRDGLLRWYDEHGRDLPWRAKLPKIPNSYHVWLSEMMLQQTTVATVIPYFQSFIEKWVTLNDLAQATQDEVLVAWQGLGYYSRARNLYKCAQLITKYYSGDLPQEQSELLKLPGIGPYISAAIASIAFNQPVVPIDGNVIRVLSRLHALKKVLPANKADIDILADSFASAERPGDFAQALMDLGAMICTPKNPQCSKCSWVNECLAFKEGYPERYPIKEAKKSIPTRYAVAYLIANAQRQILIRKREEKGLLAGLYEVPTTAWSMDQAKVSEESAQLLNDMQNPVYKGQVKHTFTHFHLNVEVFIVNRQHVQKQQDEIWVHLDDLAQFALPTLMKKVISMGYDSIISDG